MATIGPVCKKQQGITSILITLLLLVFLFFTALAVDVNHALLNKTRLQNAVDASALAAAVRVDGGASDSEAETTARNTLTSMFAAEGNTEVTLPAESITISFSNDPQDFGSSYDSSGETYVRVALTNVPLNSYFLHHFGVDKVSGASAVAGPSSSLEGACNIVPIAVCAAGGTTEDAFLGYDFGSVHQVKLAANNSEMGPGNFQLLDFGSGANTIREALAGGFEDCVDLTTVDTKPGNTVGPVADGLNTRFYGGTVSQVDYKSDAYTKQPENKATVDSNGVVSYDDPFDYQAYLDHVKPVDEGGAGCADCITDESVAELGRRILPVPIIQCTGEDEDGVVIDEGGGVNTFPVMAIGCFFLLQEANSNNAGQQGIFGEFIEDCSIKNGFTGSEPNNEGIYKIQLYKDPLSGES
ncbi:pilus assembly protein TadG-related protein [Vibrio hangzhouensis]|uniref:pilus assembly protein TadG-related protein n=1 Tax=Vibrio hangzhouensis TaxID=462991 RepID=UPI001C96AEE8|nr:pilus assembly protein TadG-related protein [Vibrio hangzhouensis]MBY6196598.1 pilus assembly protein [Vibrio hangzhouensis]